MEDSGVNSPSAFQGCCSDAGATYCLQAQCVFLKILARCRALDADAGEILVVSSRHRGAVSRLDAAASNCSISGAVPAESVIGGIATRPVC